MCINKNEELLPYYKKTKELLNYNSETGIFTWRISPAKRVKIGSEAGGCNSHGYRCIRATINGKPKLLKAHRIAWFIQYGELPDIIDHINGVKDDNSLSNLRSCTNQQNLFNRGKQANNTSGFKGVNWDKCTKKWRAQIKHNGKKMYLGLFTCPKEASEAYEAKSKELFGEFYAEEA